MSEFTIFKNVQSDIKFLKVRDVKSPSRGHDTDAGIDFYVPELTDEFIEELKEKNPNLRVGNDGFGNTIYLEKHERILMPSGIHCQMSNPNRMLCAFNKSGIASKHGLLVGASVVDFSYQGEIHLNLVNTSESDVQITSGMKIIQFIEIPVYNSEIVVEENKTLKEFYEEETSRGQGGFGSTNELK